MHPLENLLETVAVISSDEDEGLLKDTHVLELGNSSADSVIELEEIAQSTIVVENVHLLVDRGGLGHEEETLLATTLVENINSLESHLLETRKVSGIAGSARGIVLEVLDIVSVDITVQPNGHGGLAEDTESPLGRVGSSEGGLVPRDSVTLLGKLFVVVLALVATLASKELLSTSAEEDIRTLVISPAIVGLDAVESLIDEGTVLRTATGVASQSNGGGIGKEGRGDSAPSTLGDALEDFNDGLDLRVVEGVRRRVRVHTHGIDGALVAAVQGRCRVGRVGDVAVDGVGHLMTDNGKLVHLHGGLVLSVDALVSEQAGCSDLVTMLVRWLALQSETNLPCWWSCRHR